MNAHVWGLLPTLLLIVGCQTELQHGLDERDANEMVSVLAARGIGAETRRDETDRRRFVVVTAAADRTRALGALEEAGLPRRPIRSFDDIYDGPSLLPSATEERVQLQTATSGALEETLLASPGISDARVHLSLPTQRRFGRSKGPKPTASVLLVRRPREGDAMLRDDEVAGLVAGAVPDLEASEVTVVAVQGAPREIPPPADFAQVGPFTVAAASAGTLRGVLIALGAGILVLAAMLISVIVRFRRLRAAA